MLGSDSPPPPGTAGRAAPAQTPFPARRPRRGRGGLGKWASVPSPPPPPQSNFLPALWGSPTSAPLVVPGAELLKLEDITRHRGCSGSIKEHAPSSMYPRVCAAGGLPNARQAPQARSRWGTVHLKREGEKRGEGEKGTKWTQKCHFSAFL